MLWRTAGASDAGAGPRSKREKSLNRCRREAGECRCLLGAPIHPTALLRCRHHAASLQQPIDPVRDDRHDLRYVVLPEAAGRLKT
jgi:hypothetical protein